MEYKTVTDLAAIAEVRVQKPPMSRAERLRRWAECLERQPARQLNSLHEIEWAPGSERRRMRADNSPLSVAFEDAVLREEGLASDRLGDAMDFFQLTEAEAHRILCYCHHGRSMQADYAAKSVRHMANGPVNRRFGFW